MKEVFEEEAGSPKFHAYELIGTAMAEQVFSAGSPGGEKFTELHTTALDAV
jgi:hypothetical protein